MNEAQSNVNRRLIGVAFAVVGFAMTLEDVQRAMHGTDSYRTRNPRGELVTRESFWGSTPHRDKPWDPGKAEALGWLLLALGVVAVAAPAAMREDKPQPIRQALDDFVPAPPPPPPPPPCPTATGSSVPSSREPEREPEPEQTVDPETKREPEPEQTVDPETITCWCQHVYLADSLRCPNCGEANLRNRLPETNTEPTTYAGESRPEPEAPEGAAPVDGGPEPGANQAAELESTESRSRVALGAIAYIIIQIGGFALIMGFLAHSGCAPD